MDLDLLIASIVVAVVVIATLLHVVLSAAAHRYKWITALRTARELLKNPQLGPLRRALSADSPGERLGAAMALSELTTRPAAKALCKALADDKDADVRSTAATALGSRAGSEVISALSKAATSDKSTIVRGAAVEALGASRGESAVATLIEILKEGSTARWLPGLRARIALGAMAAEALSKIGGTRAVAAIGAAQASRHRAIHRAAREALSLIELKHVAAEKDADAPTMRNLAAAHVVRRDFHEAIRWLERASRIEPDHAETFETLGTLHHKLGDHRRAERCYDKAIELDPDEPFPHFGMGVIHRSRDEKAAAVAAFKRYLEVAPDGDQARSAREFVSELGGE